MVSTSILHRLCLFIVAFGLLLATASGGYVYGDENGGSDGVSKECCEMGLGEGLVGKGGEIGDLGWGLPRNISKPVRQVMVQNRIAGNQITASTTKPAATTASAPRRAGGAARGAGGTGTEVVQRWMSRAELEATQSTGLLRGGREGVHYVTDAANTSAQRARLRLALPQTPEVRVTLEVPGGTFSAPSRVQPAFNMPGGGMERTATGQIPVKILGVD
jgi:hypothetical protein